MEENFEKRQSCFHCGKVLDGNMEIIGIVDRNTCTEKVICFHCTDELEADGTITRCESCFELFTPSRLKTNPMTKRQEICPYCGDIWCK